MVDQRTGRGREIRTPDILLPKQARYQTALYPVVQLHSSFTKSGIIRRQSPGVNDELIFLALIFGGQKYPFKYHSPLV
jgi:hypothetical protein